MRSSDCDIIMVPGHARSGLEHWQSRWERKLSTARRVERDDWTSPSRDAWVSRLVATVQGCRRPVIMIAHSLGVVTAVHAAPMLPPEAVRGAFLVAPTDVEDPGLIPAIDRSFAPIPQDPLPFPSLLVASRSDPCCAYARAEDFAFAWGSALVDAGDAGHLNTESGFGPWPEGLMRFAGFLKRL
jgi:predicted alpha/beta hydrolase family esterase